MSTYNDKSINELNSLKTKIIIDFNGEENLEQYWLTTGRRKIDKDMKEKYNISFYYFKKILMTFSWFREKTKAEIEKYHIEAIKTTNLARYGVTCNWASKDQKLNGRATLKERYGVEHNSQLASWKEQVKLCWDRKTADERAAILTKILASKNNGQCITNRYFFCGIALDSYPELAFILYNTLQNKEIIREPIMLKYSFANKEYNYIPDFRVDGQLVEIKAKHWLGDYTNKNSKDYAKYQCMLKNNVKILLEEDYQW